MTEQPWFDLLCLERRAEQGIVKEVKLTDAKVVRSTPVTIHFVEHLRRERSPGLWCSPFSLAVGRNRRREAHVKDEPGRIARLIEVLAKGLRRVVLLSLDGEFGDGHRSVSFLVLRNCTHPGRRFSDFRLFSFGLTCSLITWLAFCGLISILPGASELLRDRTVSVPSARQEQSERRSSGHRPYRLRGQHTRERDACWLR